MTPLTKLYRRVYPANPCAWSHTCAVWQPVGTYVLLMRDAHTQRVYAYDTDYRYGVVLLHRQHDRHWAISWEAVMRRDYAPAQ